MRRTQALAGLFGVTLMGVLVAACGGSRQQGQISPEARLHVAEAAESSGDLGLARKMYVTAATEAWGNRTILLQAARGLARSGAPADAIALLDARLGQVPGDNEARRTLASLQIVLDQERPGFDFLLGRFRKSISRHIDQIHIAIVWAKVV